MQSQNDDGILLAELATARCYWQPNVRRSLNVGGQHLSHLNTISKPASQLLCVSALHYSIWVTVPAQMYVHTGMNRHTRTHSDYNKSCDNR